VRNVGEQGTESDDELDADLVREPCDQIAEAPPAHVRLDPEQDYRVAVEPGDRRVHERRLGPVDAPRRAVDERDVWSRHLEVEEFFGIDVREAFCVPRAREETGGQRCALAAVVPPPERADQNGPSQ
jgi:hypothetical protein